MLSRISRLLLAVAAVFSLAFAAPVSAGAQSISTAQLHGTVRDQTGAALPNAAITVTDASKGFSRTTTSDATGNYLVLQLPPGTYSVSASASGFNTFVSQGVTLNVGDQAELPLALAVGGTSATVTVESGAEIIETERSSQSTDVDQRRIENLPTNGRNYINFTLTNSQIARDAAPVRRRNSHLRPQLRRRPRPLQLHQRRWRRRRRLHLRRHPRHGLAGCRPGVPDHHQRLRGGVRPSLRRRRQHRHQIRHERHPRFSLSASSATATSRPPTPSPPSTSPPTPASRPASRSAEPSSRTAPSTSSARSSPAARSPASPSSAPATSASPPSTCPSSTARPPGRSSSREPPSRPLPSPRCLPPHPASSNTSHSSAPRSALATHRLEPRLPRGLDRCEKLRHLRPGHARLLRRAQLAHRQLPHPGKD